MFGLKLCIWKCTRNRWLSNNVECENHHHHHQKGLKLKLEFTPPRSVPLRRAQRDVPIRKKNKNPHTTAASDVLIHAPSQMCKQNSTYLNKLDSLLWFPQVQGAARIRRRRRPHIGGLPVDARRSSVMSETAASMDCYVNDHSVKWWLSFLVRCSPKIKFKLVWEFRGCQIKSKKNWLCWRFKVGLVSLINLTTIKANMIYRRSFFQYKFLKGNPL